MSEESPLASLAHEVGEFTARPGEPVLEWTGRQETLRIEPWGEHSLRVRAKVGGAILEDLPGALLESPAEEMGRRAVRLAMAQLDTAGGPQEPFTLIPPALTVRESSAPGPVV